LDTSQLQTASGHQISRWFLSRISWLGTLPTRISWLGTLPTRIPWLGTLPTRIPWLGTPPTRNSVEFSHSITMFFCVCVFCVLVLISLIKLKLIKNCFGNVLRMNIIIICPNTKNSCFTTKFKTQYTL